MSVPEYIPPAPSPSRHPAIINNAGTKPYYALSVGGKQVKIHYIESNEEISLLSTELALAWLEEKDRRTHYFLFRLADATYVLKAVHSVRNGLQVVLIKCDRPVTMENYMNAGRWKNEERIGGNLSRDVHVYLNTLEKKEGAAGDVVSIRLEIRHLRDDEVGATIENPIVIEDAA